MHVARVTSRQKGREYVSHLLRQSYREDGKVKHRTLANLSMLPPAAIEAIAAVLKGQPMGAVDEGWEIERALPHGHVLAVLGCLRQLGMDRALATQPQRERELVVALIVSRILNPCSKLATSRSWEDSTLADSLGVDGADEDDLYEALDWLLKRQAEIEKKLAAKHLSEGGVVLYDLTSTGIEGHCCPLAKLGYSRDGKRGQAQIEFGLVTNREGCPVGVEVFAGNVADPSTVASQVSKIKERFGISEVIMVGDRGMLTSARIEALKEVEGIRWISALRSDQIQALVDSGDLQLGLFDQRNLAEIAAPAFEGERLVVCKNPALADERVRKREDLLAATERELEKVAKVAGTKRCSGKDKIGIRLGKVIGRYKMEKHFRTEIGETSFSFERNQASIDAEAALDGIYVIRTSVERAFRTLKSVDLQVRPLHHHLENRVRAHIFLCMLAYYVRWHLERAWAPLLYRDEDKPVAADPVLPAQRSNGAMRKVRTQRLPDGSPAHSFRSLLEHLATLTKNRIRVQGDKATFDKLAAPTSVQQRAFSLLGVKLGL
jgi:hypothetical protein